MNIRSNNGFSLIELLITMAIFLVVLSASSNVFTNLYYQYRQQSRIAESNIESMIGLRNLKADIDRAGFGLGYYGYSTLNYSEATISPANNYNDSPNKTPRAVLAGNSIGINGSDILIIKATSIGRNSECKKWSYQTIDGVIKRWNSATEDFINAARVIVISPGTSISNQMRLVTDGTTFFTKYRLNTNDLENLNFKPTKDLNLVYALDPDSDPRMPFNRADFFISTSNVPAHCAPGTGVLQKVNIRHSDGKYDTVPSYLLDCVADFQVVFTLDMDENKEADTISNADGSEVTSTVGASTTDVEAVFQSAELIRNRLKKVDVYILAHEGRYDPNYTHNQTQIYVGNQTQGMGHIYDVSNKRNYRWKLFYISSDLPNLRKN